MRVLIVEDDVRLAERLAAALRNVGMVVDTTADGNEAGFLGYTEEYDAAVLDLGLPGQDGLSVLQHWRENGRNFPVLILTARSRWSDKRAGFGAGADDYLCKPFLIEEVIVRLQALLRRTQGYAEPCLRIGDLELDTRSGRFSLAGEPLQFTAQEARIMSYLMHHPNKTVSRGEISEHVYARDLEPDSNTVDVLIGRIRRKLGRALIHTERGFGFRLTAEQADSGQDDACSSD